MVNYSTNINKTNNHLSSKESLNSDGQLFYQAYIIYVCDTRCTDEPVHAITFIKQSPVFKRSPFSCPIIEHLIWIEPLLRGHLSYKATFPLLSEEATNTKFIVFDLTRPVLEPTTYHTRREHANHYATNAVFPNGIPYLFNNMSSLAL
jgi:hypothetical protein